MRSTLSKFVVLALVLAACSPAEGPTPRRPPHQRPPRPCATTTTAVATTTTDGGLRRSLRSTGCRLPIPTLLDRRLLAVKIDNHPNARPHSGINHADAVFEIRVEGITRFLTLWMQSDAEFLGPMRSGRPTDATLLAALNQPTFAISGAQGWVQNLIVSMDINLLTETTPAAFRVAFRRAPHNLYTTTAGLRADADARDYEDLPPTGPIWEFGPMPADAAPASISPHRLPGTPTSTGPGMPATRTWLRSADGQESGWRDEDGDRGPDRVPGAHRARVRAVLEQRPAQLTHHRDPARLGCSPTARSSKGPGAREVETEWYTLTDADGNTIAVPPGPGVDLIGPRHRRPHLRVKSIARVAKLRTPGLASLCARGVGNRSGE